MQRPSMAALTCALTCTTICATSAPRERPLESILTLELVLPLSDYQKHTSITAKMNALVGYGSSDEEDEEDVLPQRPAKVGVC